MTNGALLLQDTGIKLTYLLFLYGLFAFNTDLFQMYGKIVRHISDISMQNKKYGSTSTHKNSMFEFNCTICHV